MLTKKCFFLNLEKIVRDNELDNVVDEHFVLRAEDVFEVGVVDAIVAGFLKVGDQVVHYGGNNKFVV